jgi:hypothetical protein
MLGRRSLNLEVTTLDLEIERSLSKLRALNRNLENNMANEENQLDALKNLRDYYMPTTYVSPSCIRLPAPNGVGNFEIKPGTISMLPSFYGRITEDPYKHLDEFMEICTTFQFQHVSEESIKLRLFPFSLKDNAKHWLNTLEPNSITTWNQLQTEFLKKYFPIRKTTEYRRAITSFSRIDGEQFHESWERLRDLIRKCPHHAVPK